jgi:ankyrin repeat protein
MGYFRYNNDKMSTQVQAIKSFITKHGVYRRSNGESIFIKIIELGLVEILQDTIGTLFDIEHDCYLGTNTTPLMIACCEKSFRCVMFLIKNGANVNAKDIYGRTPLIFAASNGNGLHVEVLLRHGADVDAVGQDGFTALSRACQYDYYDIAKSLILNGAYV